MKNRILAALVAIFSFIVSFGAITVLFFFPLETLAVIATILALFMSYGVYQVAYSRLKKGE